MEKRPIAYIILDPCRLPDGIFERTISRIQIEDRRITRRNALGCLSVSAASTGVFVVTIFWVYSDMSNSGFLHSFNLLFSDSSTVMEYWQDFSSMLLEALPYISIAACLAAIGLVAVSLSYTSKYKTYYSKLIHN